MQPQPTTAPAQSLHRAPGYEPFEDEADAEQLEQRQRAEAEARRAALGALVCRRKREAVHARQASGIEGVWRQAEDQYNGYDELNQPSTVLTPVAAASRAVGTDNRSRVFLNITQPRTDAAEARICEMLLPTDDKPWAIEPTPIPEFADAVEQGDTSPMQLADGTTVPANLLAQTAIDKAQVQAKNASRWIEDQFVEGRVYGELRKVFRDAARLGTGILKGPVPVVRTDKKWSVKDGVAELVMRERIAPTSKSIPPWNFYPDPACGESIHNGSYCLEYDTLTARQLRRLASEPGYQADEIEALLAEGPNRGGSEVATDRAGRNFPGDTRAADSEVFDVWYHYGDVPREDLAAMGLDDLPDGSHLSAIVTVVNDRAIKAVLNPLETGEFPYDVMPWEPVPGQVWGRGVPTKMSTPQRMLNAAARRLLDNAGLSAGAQIAIRKGAVTPADGSYQITGLKLWYFDSDDATSDIRQAMQVFTIPSVQAELSAIIQFALQMADETAAVPALLQGEQSPGQPETLGGQTQRLNQASSMLRRVAKTGDDCIFVPHLTRYYDWCMQFGPEECKGDLQVKARGSSTLVQRDQSNQFLVQTAALVGNPAFEINPAKWFAETCKANHFDPKTIQYSEDEKRDLAKKQGEQQPTDPRIEAAQLRNQAVQAQIQADQQNTAMELQFRQQDAEADRQHQLLIKELEREIQVMEFAGRRAISFEQLKAMLATKAADNRLKATLFDKEAQLKLAQGSGI